MFPFREMSAHVMLVLEGRNGEVNAAFKGFVEEKRSGIKSQHRKIQREMAKK